MEVFANNEKRHAMKPKYRVQIAGWTTGLAGSLPPHAYTHMYMFLVVAFLFVPFHVTNFLSTLDGLSHTLSSTDSFFTLLSVYSLFLIAIVVPVVLRVISLPHPLFLFVLSLWLKAGTYYNIPGVHD